MTEVYNTFYSPDLFKSNVICYLKINLYPKLFFKHMHNKQPETVQLFKTLEMYNILVLIFNL